VSFDDGPRTLPDAVSPHIGASPTPPNRSSWWRPH